MEENTQQIVRIPLKRGERIRLENIPMHTPVIFDFEAESSELTQLYKEFEQDDCAICFVKKDDRIHSRAYEVFQGEIQTYRTLNERLVKETDEYYKAISGAMLEVGL